MNKHHVVTVADLSSCSCLTAATFLLSWLNYEVLVVAPQTYYTKTSNIPT